MVTPKSGKGINQQTANELASGPPPAPVSTAAPNPTTPAPNSLYDLGGGGPPPPAASTSTTASNFIGPAGYQLPDTYTAPVSSYQDADAYGSYTVNLPQPVQMAPRYSVGDELTPLRDSWPPERIVQIQNQMVTAGLLKSRNFQLGFWDAPSIAAYRELLGYSNVSGNDSDTTLTNFKAIIDKYGDTTTGANRVRQPFISELTDPNTLRDTLDAVSVRTMGRGMTEAEKAHFVDSFRATQEQTQRSKYDLAGDMDTTTGAYTGTGGSVTAPDPESDANAYIKSTNPDAVKEYNYLNAFKAFQSLLSSSGA